MLGGGFGLHQAGILKLTPEQDQQVAGALSAAESKIADLEQKLGEITSSAAGSDAGGALSALEGKVAALEGKLEDAVSATSTDAGSAVDALKQELEGLKSEVASVSAVGGGGAAVDLTPLQDRVSALENSPSGSSPVDVKPIEDRLEKLEAATSSSSSEAEKLSGSVSGLDTQLGELKLSLGELQTQLDNTAATAKAAQTAVSTSDVSLKTLADSQARATETLSSLSADIKSVGSANNSAMETIRSELEAMSKRLAAVEATMGDATAREVAARALSVSALKSAVDSGRPYETELAAVKAGLPSDIDLNALEAHASKGVEPVAVLIAQFPPVSQKIYQTFAEPDRTGDVIDNLLSSARSIVSVRGLGDGEGSGPEAALHRMDTAVSQGDLKAAIAAYQELPADAQSVAATWVARAQARVEVDDLTNKASEEVLNALANKES